MKNLFFISLSFLLFSGIYAQTSEYVGLRMQVSELKDDTVKATLVTDHFVNMIAFEFNLNWNTAHLEFIDLDYTNRNIGLLPDFFNIDNVEQGRVRVIWSTAGCETTAAGDSLFSIIFIQKTDEFVIVPPPEQMLFYDCEGNELRMEYIDNQGQKTFFGEPPTGLDEISKTEIDWRIYPNPTSDYISLEFSQPISGSLKIYNSSGKLIITKPLFNNIDFKADIRNLSSGQYFLEVIDNNLRLQESVIIK